MVVQDDGWQVARGLRCSIEGLQSQFGLSIERVSCCGDGGCRGLWAWFAVLLARRSHGVHGTDECGKGGMASSRFADPRLIPRPLRGLVGVSGLQLHSERIVTWLEDAGTLTR